MAAPAFGSPCAVTSKRGATARPPVERRTRLQRKATALCSGRRGHQRAMLSGVTSWQKRAEVAETALARAEAGRTRLRGALAEQRQEAEDRLIEQGGSFNGTEAAARAGGGGGGAMSESQMEKLRVKIEGLLKEKEP